MQHDDTYTGGGYLFFSTNTTDNVTYFVRYVNSTVNETLTLGCPVRRYYISGNFQVESSSFDDRFKGIHLEANLPITLNVVDNLTIPILLYHVMTIKSVNMNIIQYLLVVIVILQ